jgi:FdhE protein
VPDERHRPVRAPRAEPRDIVELRLLRESQPDLASAIDLQIALLELQHRVRARLPVPWIEVDSTWLRQQQVAGRPLLRFEDIPLAWTDFRLVFRQTADLLLRFEALESADHANLQSIIRNGHALEPLVIAWYNAKAAPDRMGAAVSGQPPAAAEPAPDDGVSEGAFEQVLQLSMRPFLERCAEVLMQRTDFSPWTEPYCPLCGGEPEFAVISAAADRLLICSRCTARWRYHPLACPYCRNDDRTKVTSFATRDGRYRIYACDVCQRYIKAYDARSATRPVLLAVDSIATLPLDAAAIQRGYRG